MAQTKTLADELRDCRKAAKQPQVFYIAELPDAYGYGVIGYGKTPGEAERVCKAEYFTNGRHGEATGWQHRPWKEAKEYWGFNITIATTGKAHLVGCGEYVDLDA